MSSTPKQQQVVQSTQLPPQFQRALDSVLNQANALQPQPTYGYRPATRDVNVGMDQYGYSGFSYPESYMERYQTGTTGGVTDITPDLSSQTLRGIDVLSQGPDAQAMNLLRATAGGQYLNSNPFSGQTNLSGVTDAITQAATKAVGDRFSQAGRTGSPGEGLALGNEVARQLAPYAFGANESALTRGFNSYENERARQLNSALPLMNVQQQYGQNLINAGSIIEEQQRQQMLEPFNLFNLRTDPLIRALGGAPTTTTTTQPVYRNRAAGALGGITTGLGLGSLGAATGATGLAAFGPYGIPLAIGGGLLGML